MAANEERVFDDIDNLLEAEGILTSSSPQSTKEGPYKPSVDWRAKMKGSSFKKSLRKEPAIHTSYEEDSPFDESLPFDESFSGLGLEEQKKDDPIDKENVGADLFNSSLNPLPITEEEESTTTSEETEVEEATSSTDFFWYRNNAEVAARVPTELMNEVLVAEGMITDPTIFDCSMERSMEMAVTDVNDELMDIITQTTPTKNAQAQPTQDQQFVMDILSAPVDSPISSPTKEVMKHESPVQTRNDRTSTFDEFNPYGSDEMEELDHALKSMTLAQTRTDFMAAEKAITSPNKRDLIAIDATPITPPPHDHDVLIDPAYCNTPESGDEEEGIVRIQLTDEEVYGSDFAAKALAEHPALVQEHNFSLHRNIQVNSMDAFRDEPSITAPPVEEEEAPVARVMNILSPLRNLLTPQKWKGSPKTPATVGESPAQEGDVERGFGDAILRSNLFNQFQFAVSAAEDDEEYIHWKDRYCTKRQVYLMTILIALVIAFIAVISVIVGMQNEEVVVQEGINDFYKVTEDGSN